MCPYGGPLSARRTFSFSLPGMRSSISSEPELATVQPVAAASSTPQPSVGSQTALTQAPGSRHGVGGVAAHPPLPSHTSVPLQTFESPQDVALGFGTAWQLDCGSQQASMQMLPPPQMGPIPLRVVIPFCEQSVNPDGWHMDA